MRHVWSIGLVVLASCGKDTPPPAPRRVPPAGSAAPAPAAPPKVTGPLAFQWKDVYGTQKFTTVDGPGKGEVFASGEVVMFSLDGFPDGTTYIAAGAKGVIKDKATASPTISIGDGLGKVSWKSIDKADTGARVTITLPDGRQGDLVAPPLSMTGVVTAVFGRISSGPVKFADEPVDSKPADSAVVIGLIGDTPTGGTVVGKKGTLAETDFVVTETVLKTDEKGRKTCKGYKDDAGNPVGDLTIVQRQSEVTLWNRRTGEVVEKAVLPHELRCPDIALRWSKGAGEQDTVISPAKLEAWVKKKLKG